MAQVRCPQCGAVTGTHAPDYPFCVGCQDNLAKCGYCRWFDGEAGVCLNSRVAGLFEATPDATPPCDQHAPGELVVVRARSHLALAVLGTMAALLVLVYAVMVLWEPTPASSGPVQYLQLAMESGYHGAVVGVPYTVIVELRNPAEEAVTGVRLQVSHESRRGFKLLRVTPKPARQKDVGLWLMLTYPEIEARATTRVNLELLPLRAGTYHVSVRLVSGGMEYHGMADLPIVVKAKPSTEEA